MVPWAPGQQSLINKRPLRDPVFKKKKNRCNTSHLPIHVHTPKLTLNICTHTHTTQKASVEFHPMSFTSAKKEVNYAGYIAQLVECLLSMQELGPQSPVLHNTGHGGASPTLER